MTGRGRVTGNYAGAVTRLLAFIADAAIVTITFSMFLAISGFAINLIWGHDLDLSDDGSAWWLLGIAAYAGFYAWVGLVTAGRTFGKSIVGLRVVDRSGGPLMPRAATIRVVTFPLNFLLFGLGFAGIVFDRERRALHDYLAKSAVVYDWGDRPAELPAPLSRWLDRRNAVETPTTPPIGDDQTAV